MLQMAGQTAGHAFINTNGLADAVVRSIEMGSNYYTLTYSLATQSIMENFTRYSSTFNAKASLLHIFAATTPTPPSHTPAPSTAADESLADRMLNAIIFGSPSPTQITLKVLVVPAAGKPEETLAAGNFGSPSARFIGPYRRYDITIAANPGDIVFTSSTDGNRHTRLLFRTYLFANDGKLLNTSSRVSEMTGLFLHQEISVPLKAEGYLRIGVHDATGIGTALSNFLWQLLGIYRRTSYHPLPRR